MQISGNGIIINLLYIKWIQVEKAFLATVQSDHSFEKIAICIHLSHEPQSHASHLANRGLSIRDAEACTWGKSLSRKAETSQTLRKTIKYPSN